ncbi:SdpI family protein, partial [Lacticaseibacillus rhamnosus]
HQTGLWGYTSYLASVNADSFRLAQRWFYQALIATGAVEGLAGWAIHRLAWDNYFIIWLFLAVLLFLPGFVYTESRLKHYLEAHDALPYDYVAPDDAPRPKRRKGFKDL